MFDSFLLALYHIALGFVIQNLLKNTVQSAQKRIIIKYFVIFYPRGILKNLLTFGAILIIIIVDRYIVRCCILKDHTAGIEPLFTDEELLAQFRSGSDDAFEKLASRYLGLISSSAAKYRGVSADTDSGDMVQEGMVAMLSACRSYNSEKGMSFKNYLMLCVENRYRSLMRAANRKGAVPAQNIISIEDEQDTAFDPTASSLPELLESKEYIDALRCTLKNRLSELEYKVAIMHLSGYTYKEISERLNISLKSVDNAQTRIRQKLS